MIHSMTAFARQERQGDWGTLTWELRSVNHRYLEISARLPEELRGLEAQVRERVGKRLKRGKVECNLRLRGATQAPPALEVNQAYLGRLLEACGEVEAMMGPAGTTTALELLRWPGVVREAERDLAPLLAAALELLETALEDLVASRVREGEQIDGLIRSRCQSMESLVAETRARLPAVHAAMRERLTARLGELETAADPARLEQELVIMANKIDVDEELDRLQGHLKEVQHVLERNEPVGRRLDFLMQEFNREANTLGSKSADSETTRASVELKVLIEQMREQIQNVE